MGVSVIGTLVFVASIVFCVWSAWYDLRHDDVPLDELLAQFRKEEEEKAARKALKKANKV